jgi:hypothetical protein
MTAIAIVLGHDVEEERLHVVVEGFGSQKELRKEAEVLTIDGVLSTVNLEEGVLAVAVDFIARRVLCGAFELFKLALVAV